MNPLPIITLSLALALVSGCQKTLNWTPLDGGSADAAALEKARKACRIDIKLAGVERAEEEREQKLRSSTTDQAKMLANEDYEQLRRQVYREIDACMRKQGYKR